jgi:hypothetical protein
MISFGKGAICINPACNHSNWDCYPGKGGLTPYLVRNSR